MSSDDIDTSQLRAAFVQAQAQIMNNGAYEPVVVISKPLALSLLDEIERLRAELEQANLNLQHARTGKALLELEQERARTAELRNAFSELAELCQRLLTERFNDMTEGAGGTPTPTLPATDTTAP